MRTHLDATDWLIGHFDDRIPSPETFLQKIVWMDLLFHSAPSGGGKGGREGGREGYTHTYTE